MSSEEEKQTASEGVALLEERLQYSFQSKELLLYALTHRSATNKEKRNDYERLEFLGDAVLDLVVADLLLQAHPEAREGELSKMRAALVNTTSLAEIARELELNKFILVSRAERAQAGHERPSILADVMESLIGAIYREAGFEKARTVASALFGRKIINVDPTDPKTELQEALHTLSLDPPEYLLDYVEGPEHAPTFIS
ncbi:MAG: ribonuclease III, partial [Bdellovibrionales bacterium]|nr:ribonuclease III [Bdellovibrionales bacterium]